jgi:thioredoxin reductase (NADPH)
MQRMEVILVGAGPIGLELAVALKRLQADYLHLEKRQIAQTISWFPYQTRFFSSPERIAIANVPFQTPDQSKATREDYLAYLRGIVQQFDLDVKTYERVVQIQRQENQFILDTRTQSGKQNQYLCQYVILAVGDMARPRLLNIAGEDLPHVSHYFHEPHQYFRRRLLIIGGKNSAVEAALRCHHAGVRVAISYRQNAFSPGSIKYWLLPEINLLTRTQQIPFYNQTIPIEIRPEEVVLRSTEYDKQITVPADFVLCMTGYTCDSTLFEMAGVRLQDESAKPLYNPKTMETNVPGLFVAGTAAAGAQKEYRLFIENCHEHVGKIVKAITGKEISPSKLFSADLLERQPES